MPMQAAGIAKRADRVAQSTTCPAHPIQQPRSTSVVRPGDTVQLYFAACHWISLMGWRQGKPRVDARPPGACAVGQKDRPSEGGTRPAVEESVIGPSHWDDPGSQGGSSSMIRPSVLAGPSCATIHAHRRPRVAEGCDWRDPVGHSDDRKRRPRFAWQRCGPAHLTAGCCRSGWSERRSSRRSSVTPSIGSASMPWRVRRFAGSHPVLAAPRRLPSIHRSTVRLASLAAECDQRPVSQQMIQAVRSARARARTRHTVGPMTHAYSSNDYGGNT